MLRYISILIAFCFTLQISFAQKFDRSVRPKPAAAPVIKLGDTKTFELENGLKVFVVENTKLPRVSFSLVLDIDPELEGNSAGLQNAFGELMSSGTLNRSKEQLNNEIDFMGASLNTSATGLNASSLKKHTEKLLAIMADVVMNPDFKNEELEKIKTNMLSSLAAEKDNPDAIIAKVQSALVFGKNHPYGEIETEETVNNISLDKCKNFYNTYWKPNVAYLAVVGDITLEEAKKLIEKYFLAWKRAEVPKTNYPIPSKLSERNIALVHKTGAVQSVINVSNYVNLKPGSPDEIKVRVMNNILGGGMSSRLFMNLRETHGWTYGSYSRISSDRLASSFTAYAKVRNAVTDSSIHEIFNELNRIRNEVPTKEEVEGIKNYLTGTFAMSLEDPKTIANFAINIERYGLPKDYYANYLKRLSDVTPDDVKEMAQKYIQPENCWIIVVGNRDEIKDKISKFSKNGKVDLYDIYANPVSDIKPAPKGISSQTVVNNYIEAIGGQKSISKIKDLSMVYNATIQGMSIEMKSYQKAPNKYMMQIGMGEMIFQKMVYDGVKGRASGMQGTQDLQGEDLEELQYQAIMFPETQYEKLGFKINLKGVDAIDGKDAYVLEITNPKGSKSTEYFDVKSGLKLRSVRTSDSPQGPITQTTDYADYKDVKGVKFPHEINQTAGPQSFKLKAKTIEVNKKLKDTLFEIK
ncbi:MAG: M16 family metallopeptidase [Bacteroidia bacterium]